MRFSVWPKIANRCDRIWFSVNPSNLGATKLWLGLTEFTSSDSKSSFGVTKFNKSVAPKCFLWRTKTKFLTRLFWKNSGLCDAHPLYLIYIYSQGLLSVIAKISDQSDCQNKPEEHVQLSEGSDPWSTSDDGSRSTPSNFPKAATRTRKKKTSDSEDWEGLGHPDSE